MIGACLASAPALSNAGGILGSLETPSGPDVLDRGMAALTAVPFAASALSIGYVTNFFGVERAGLLLNDAGLLDGAVALPPTVSRLDFWQLCLNNVNLCDDEGHGCTPCRLPKSTWTVIFSAVNQMETLGDGLRRFAELVPLIQSGVVVTVGYGDSGIHLNFGSTDIRLDERFEQYLELMALVFHCVLLWVTAARIEPVQMRLSSLLPEADGSILAGLTTERVRQGRGVTLVYARNDMSLPLGVRKYQYWSNETKVFQQLCSTWQPDSVRLPSAIVETVGNLVATRGLTLEQIASIMGMSIATLQRRLREAGTGFREIAKDMRCRKMLSLLATDINFDDVAEELGLSERRSLWRICHEWLGVSPSEYRRRHRCGDVQLQAA